MRLIAATGKRLLALMPVTDFPGLFEGQIKGRKHSVHYFLKITRNNHTWSTEDPYRFGPVLGELDEYLIGEGAHLNLWEVLGAHLITHEKTTGVHFAV